MVIRKINKVYEKNALITTKNHGFINLILNKKSKLSFFLNIIGKKGSVFGKKS